MKDCNQCGKCCIKYGDGRLSVTTDEIRHWQQYYPDIAEYARNGEIWIDPQSGEQLDHCPWLRKESATAKYTCAIYHARPDDCRQYPTLLNDMIRDACEMLEPADFENRQAAQRQLQRLIRDNQPG